MSNVGPLQAVDVFESPNALSYSNYRRFFVGNSLSNVGNWFQTLAQALLVIKITGRASSLGEVFAIQTLPLLVLGPFIGSFFDRTSLRKILVIVSAAACLEAFALAALVETRHATILWIFCLCVVFGLCQLFQQPAVRAIVSELLPNAALASGVSLNTVQQSVGRLAGPALAGAVYAWRGAPTCFVINGISYVVVLLAVLSLRPGELHSHRIPERSSRQFLDALSYVWNSPFHRRQLLACLAVGCLSFNFPLVWALMTQFVLNSGAASLGLSTSIGAATGLVTGLVLARKLRHPTQRTYIAWSIWFGLSLALAAVSPNLTFFYVTMGIFGVTVIVYNTCSQTVLQLNTPRERIGSVMTLLAYCQQGTTPIGSLIVAFVAAASSARYAVGIGAIAAVGAGFVLILVNRRTQTHGLQEPSSSPDVAVS